MSDAPATVNASAKAIDDIIHSAIMGAALNAAIAAATAEAPWLGFPIIKQLFSWAAGYLFGFADKYIEQAAAFAVIDGQAAHESAEYQTQVDKLSQAVKSGDKNAIDQASKAFDDALAKLIHYDGS